MAKDIISTSHAPEAIGAYSQAVISRGVLYSSGMLGINPATGQLVADDFRAQAEQVLRNLEAILSAAGCTTKHILKTTVYLTDMTNFPILNELYAQHFVAPYPARSAVAVKQLPKNALIEIDLIAGVNE